MKCNELPIINFKDAQMHWILACPLHCQVTG
jgi:hypothetical protein